MADQGLQIAHSEVKNLNRRYLRGSRFRLEVLQTIGDLPTEVFLYRRRDADEVTGEVVDEFIGVASPLDLSTYPANDPDPDLPNAYLRLSYVELDFQAQSHHEDVYQLLIEQLGVLVEAFKRSALYVDPQTHNCGTDDSSISQ